jgi:hypothetical protein
MATLRVHCLMANLRANFVNGHLEGALSNGQLEGEFCKWPPWGFIVYMTRMGANYVHGHLGVHCLNGHIKGAFSLECNIRIAWVLITFGCGYVTVVSIYRAVRNGCHGCSHFCSLLPQHIFGPYHSAPVFQPAVCTPLTTRGDCSNIL